MTENEYTMQGTRYRSAYYRTGIKFGSATAASLDEAGETLLASTKASIAKYDPDGTALKFAFITDHHRSEEGVYASSTVDDRYSIRLLSRLCDDIDIDAVFCGGDITNARDENVDYIRKNMEDVIDDLDDMLPYTNVFGTIGNHDKRYNGSRTNNTNEWLHGIWDHVQQDGNGVELTYIDDTNFYVDFVRHKVRIIFINQYDAVDDNSSWTAGSRRCRGTWTQALNISDKADWLVGAVIHGEDVTGYNITGFNYTQLHNSLTAYVNGGGKGVIGIFGGHLHVSQGRSINSMSALATNMPEATNPEAPINLVHVSPAYAEAADLGTASEYCFSVIVLDAVTGLFHEIRVGKNATEIPFCSYFGTGANNGLLQNGTASPNGASNYNHYCVYNGNHVRFDVVWMANGYNFTNLQKELGYSPGDFVTNDTENVLFSAEAGDVIKTEVIFSDDTEDVTTPVNFKVFSPQIADMLVCKVTSGTAFTNEITLGDDTDVTAIGVNYYGGSQPYAHVMDFELNIYKNGVRLVRNGS